MCAFNFVVKRFADVVEQRGPSGSQLPGSGSNGMGRVGVDVVGVKPAVLLKIHARLQLWDHLGDYWGKPLQITGIYQKKQFT